MSVTGADRRPLPPRLIVAAAAALAYAWVAAGLRPFTEPENLLAALPMIPVVLLAARRGRSGPTAASPPAPAPRQRGAVVWVVLFAAAATWELLALSSSPRAAHPTLSSIADRIMSTHPGRTAVFLAWLALGVALARRRHRDERR